MTDGTKHTRDALSDLMPIFEAFAKAIADEAKGKCSEDEQKPKVKAA